MGVKVYFKNLNSLRFIAALIVLVSHVSQLVGYLGVDEKFAPVIYSPIAGELGVILFFALSGFLITYLLLAENEISKTINLKAFYIRRALRIWPLYFLTIALALFVLPFINFLVYKGYDATVIWVRLPLKILFYCVFMPNIVMDFIGFIPYATHSWTIGAEEQFYFIWPVLFKKIKNKVFILIFVVIIYLVVYYLLLYFPQQNKYTKIAFLIWSRYPISCMAIGGVYGYLVFCKKNAAVRIKKVLFSFWMQIAMFLILTGCLIIKANFKYLNNEIYSVILGYVVCNLAANPNAFFSIENKWLNYLGKISYGLYMFHPLAISCAVKICVIIRFTHYSLLYPLAFVIAVVFAALSYQLFERYFIKQKTKYSVIISGDNVKWAKA